MATRLYFHAATNALSNLPTTEQSSLTSVKDVDAQTVNRTMDTTIGTSQTSIVLTSNATSSLQDYYFTRFVSPALSGISSITAQTWTYNIATMESNTSANFPCATQNSVRTVAYVWRPSSQTKVGNIRDNVSDSTTTEGTASTERSHFVTFAGSLVSSISNGDVICFEVWFSITQLIATAYTDTFYFDGTTATTTDNTTVSSHASFLETPQTLTFAAAGGPVDCTVTGKTIYNKTTSHA